MRPVRLDIDGFASYREPAHVDFTDVDYFALIGPTGSGKSTIIDAITFALYGTAHRWERSNAVAYALAPTANRCTVSLIFDVSGQRYQAVREVRRVGQNVQQKAARLERFLDPTVCPAPGDPAPETEVLASEVRDMTPTVTDLLGLEFDDFCQCVVLPQGEFARFLKAKASERQTILLKLLGAGHYEQIRAAAGVRARDAEQETKLYTEQLAGLAHATPAALADATAAQDRLARLAEQVTGLVAPVLTSRNEQATQQGRVEQTQSAAAALAAITVPDGLAGRHATVVAARGEYAAATTVAGQTATDLTAAIAAAEAGPQRLHLETVGKLYSDQAQVAADLADAEVAVEEATATDATAQKAAETAAATLRAGRDREQLTRGDRDSTAAQVTRLTDLAARTRAVTVPADLDAVATAAADAAAAVRDAELAVAEAKQAVTAAAAACDPLPDDRTLTALHADRVALTERVRAWADQQSALTALDTDVSRTQTALEAAVHARNSAWAALEQARADDAAAALRPTLSVGHACPVCTQTVTELPPPAEGGAVDAATVAWQQTEDTHATAEAAYRDAVATAEKARDRVHTQHDDLTGMATRLAAAVAAVAADAGWAPEQPLLPAGFEVSVPAVDAFAAEVAKALTLTGQRCADAFAARTKAVEDADGADRAWAVARAAQDEATQQAAAVTTGLVRAHAGVTADGAPPVDASSLAEAVTGWQTLDAWCRDTATRIDTEQLPAAEAARGAYQQAVDALATAEKSAAAADRDARAAATDLAAVTSRVQHLSHRLGELADQLTGAPALADLPGLLAEADRLAEQRKQAAAADAGARSALEEATGRLRAAQDAVAADRDALSQARDTVAAWGPPTFDGAGLADDLAGCWDELARWATGAADQACAEMAQAHAAAAAAEEDAERLLALLVTELKMHDLDTSEVAADPRAAERVAAVAHTKAIDKVAALTRDRDKAAGLTEKVAEASERALVAGELRSLLRSDKFQQWLATAALDTLVAGASDGLRQLSDGQFTLTHDRGDFYVIDHFDADSRRSVKTLSGGETFQASLALALALSEQLAALAIGGTARLDSIFLDEGFGTLDPESLETVAATLETLAQGERMVGVVTHVPALADRTPVRFTVSHDHRTSRVEREAL